MRIGFTQGLNMGFFRNQEENLAARFLRWQYEKQKLPAPPESDIQQQAGRIVEQGLTERILAAPEHPYTRALLDAVPSIDPGRRRRRPARPVGPADGLSEPGGRAG